MRDILLCMVTTKPSTPLPHDVTGSGSPLLFVHAFPFDAGMWGPQREGLSSRHQVVTPDLSGFGRAHDWAPRASMEEHAADLVALLDALEIPRATLVGLSMGGYIALAFARRYPARLAGLVLADTKATGDSPEAKAGRAKSIALVESSGVPALVQTLLPKLVSAEAPSSVKERVERMASAQPAAGVKAALAAMRERPDESPVLGGLAVPALVLVGEGDSITPPTDARQMIAAIPRGSLALLPGTAHLANQDAPEAFNGALAEWLFRYGI